jgi:hypothetical protein
MKVLVVYSDKHKKVLFRLLEPVQVLDFTIPIGFETDFASVPKSLWNILPPLGRHNKAALLHDYLYDNRIGNRSSADWLFLQVMIESRVNLLAAITMYLGVRIGGRKWWVEDEKTRNDCKNF